jgi:hypothetical protein
MERTSAALKRRKRVARASRLQWLATSAQLEGNNVSELSRKSRRARGRRGAMEGHRGQTPTAVTSQAALYHDTMCAQAGCQ